MKAQIASLIFIALGVALLYTGINRPRHRNKALVMIMVGGIVTTLSAFCLIWSLIQ